MNTYRITYVNPAFSPRPSHWTTGCYSPAEAVRAFHASVRSACIVRSAGQNGVCKLERAVEIIDAGAIPQTRRIEWREELIPC